MYSHLQSDLFFTLYSLGAKLRLMSEKTTIGQTRLKINLLLKIIELNAFLM